MRLSDAEIDAVFDRFPVLGERRERARRQPVRRRAAVAHVGTAVVTRPPRVLIADEPTLGLAPLDRRNPDGAVRRAPRPRRGAAARGGEGPAACSNSPTVVAFLELGHIVLWLGPRASRRRPSSAPPTWGRPDEPRRARPGGPLRWGDGGRRGRPRRSRRPDRRADRSERRRQDHAVRHDLRRRTPTAGRCWLDGADVTAQERGVAGPPRHPPHVPAPADLRLAQRRGQRPRRAGVAGRGRRHPRRPRRPADPQAPRA